METIKSESNKNGVVNVDNKELLKTLIETASNFKDLSSNFAQILEKIFLNGLKGTDLKVCK